MGQPESSGASQKLCCIPLYKSETRIATRTRSLRAPQICMSDRSNTPHQRLFSIYPPFLACQNDVPQQLHPTCTHQLLAGGTACTAKMPICHPLPLSTVTTRVSSSPQQQPSSPTSPHCFPTRVVCNSLHCSAASRAIQALTLFYRPYPNCLSPFPLIHNDLCAPEYRVSLVQHLQSYSDSSSALVYSLAQHHPTLVTTSPGAICLNQTRVALASTSRQPTECHPYLYIPR